MDTERDNKRRLEVNDLVDKLEIRKCINMDFGDLNDESLEIAIDSQESILKLVKEQPDLLPFVIKELVYKGTYFEAMTRIYMADTETLERDSIRDSQVDSLWTSQMMAETLVGIGEDALTYLNSFDNDFAKKSIKKIQNKYLKE